MAQRRKKGGPDPLARPRLYEHLASHIADFIEAQGLGPGDRLPPERQLAADLGVSRATLSRALAALETQGRIEVRHGVGALVRAPETPGDLGVSLAQHESDEVAVAREAVLAGLARAAAAHPRKAVRIAMLGDDGTVREFDEIWRCVRRLSGTGLLGDLDDAMAAQLADPAPSAALQQRLDELAAAVVRGDPSAAALACHGMLTETD